MKTMEKSDQLDAAAGVMTMSLSDPADVQEQDCDAQYDFSCLPETVWVKVFEFLPVSDQYHVSTTCHTLYSIFNHPSNWKSACLSAVGGDHNFSLSYSFLPDRFKIIVDKFGHFFQRLTISFTGHLVRMQDDVREVLIHMSQVCRLEHLVIEVGLMTSDFHLHGFRPLQKDLESILLLVGTAFRLKKIEILSWPMFPEMFDIAEVNVFEAMKKNPKLETLESLSLFWMKNKQWSERLPLLPSPFYTFSFLSHFRSLQHLAVRSPMLSNDLFQELASSSRLRLLTLKILVSYVAHDPKHCLPEITSASWTALVNRSPGLEVEIVVMSRIPDLDIGTILRPEVPLTAIKILKFARCSEALIFSLKEKFKNTLVSFICYHDPTDCENELLRLVEACSKLQTLVFHGQVHCSKLMTIVKQRKNWKHFEFIERNIVTESLGEEFDDDTVIGQDASGDLVLVGLLRFHGQETEAERKEFLTALNAEVSERIGYSWKPSTS